MCPCRGCVSGSCVCSSPCPRVRNAPPVILSEAQRAAIATAFAPTLFLHPLEKYMPTSPISASDDVPEGWRARVARYEARLRTPSCSRPRSDTACSRAPATAALKWWSSTWCYYVYNAFTVRGAWLPYRVPDNHPHDLERLFIVLTPRTGAIDREDLLDVSVGASLVPAAKRSSPMRTTAASRPISTTPAAQRNRRSRSRFWSSAGRTPWRRTSTRTGCSHPA